jgi:hypothetical protein
VTDPASVSSAPAREDVECATAGGADGDGGGGEASAIVAIKFLTYIGKIRMAMHVHHPLICRCEAMRFPSLLIGSGELGGGGGRCSSGAASRPALPPTTTRSEEGARYDSSIIAISSPGGLMRSTSLPYHRL